MLKKDASSLKTEENKSLNRRQFLKTTAAAAGVATFAPPLFKIGHAWAQDVSYNGEVFDAKGATLNVGEWGGYWEEFVRKSLTDQFEKDFNCKIAWDSSWPWTPKFVANGPKNPVFDICNWNLPMLFKTAKIGDFFVPLDELRENVPNSKNCWPFAFDNKFGVTWGYAPYVYVYRTDKADPVPTSFKAFWEPQYANFRGTYITSNPLFMTWFLTSSIEFGSGQHDMEAGFKAVKEAMPLKISDFTGNMMQLVVRGEVTIGVLFDGEALSLRDSGSPVDIYTWEPAPILTQTKTVSRYSDPVQKKLAYALMNRTLAPEFLKKFGDTFYMRPTNKTVPMNALLEKQGIKNTKDATKGLWVPDWDFWAENEEEIVERVNEIYTG